MFSKKKKIKALEQTVSDQDQLLSDKDKKIEEFRFTNNRLAQQVFNNGGQLEELRERMVKVSKQAEADRGLAKACNDENLRLKNENSELYIRVCGLEREIRDLNKEHEDLDERFNEMYSNMAAVFCQMGNTWTPEKVYFAEFLRANYDWDMVRIVINLLYRTNHSINACQKAVKWHRKEGAK